MYKGSIEVTANGSKTYKTLFNELAGNCDFSKIRDTSCLEIKAGGAVTSYLCQQYGTLAAGYTNNFVVFGSSRAGGLTSAQLQVVAFSNDANQCYFVRVDISSTTTAENRLSQIPSSSIKIKLIY